MSAWVYCATCRAPHQAVEVGEVHLVPCPRVTGEPWILSGGLAPRRVGVANCQRCSAPAHPIRGYCGRFCEEAARYEAEHRESGSIVWRKPGAVARIAGLDPVTPEETTAAYAEVYATIERDVLRAYYLGEQPVDPHEAWLADPRTFGGKS